LTGALARNLLAPRAKPERNTYSSELGFLKWSRNENGSDRKRKHYGSLPIVDVNIAVLIQNGTRSSPRGKLPTTIQREYHIVWIEKYPKDPFHVFPCRLASWKTLVCEAEDRFLTFLCRSLRVKVVERDIYTQPAIVGMARRHGGNPSHTMQ